MTGKAKQLCCLAGCLYVNDIDTWHCVLFPSDPHPTTVLAGRRVSLCFYLEDGITTYVHYGSDRFIPEYFLPIRNGGWHPKPAEGSGLWASREGDELGWKAWCKENRFQMERLSLSFRFQLPGATISDHVVETCEARDRGNSCGDFLF